MEQRGLCPDGRRDRVGGAYSCPWKYCDGQIGSALKTYPRDVDPIATHHATRMLEDGLLIRQTHCCRQQTSQESVVMAGIARTVYCTEQAASPESFAGHTHVTCENEIWHVICVM